MTRIEYAKRATTPAAGESETARTLVSEIIQRVRREGTNGVRYYMEKFDQWNPPSFRVADDEIQAAEDAVPAQLKEDVVFLHEQVERFAKAQMKTLSAFEMETLPGLRVGQRYIPLESVGVYVPGGRYTLVASAQMSIVPAKVAGVSRVVACAPPKDGRINPAVLYSMKVAGADEIYSLAGAQAIAAMAFGTDELRAVDMIAGPGNRYVVEAKRQVYGTVGIDFIPGPTEILIIADESQDAEIVAADLLAQAEHDVDAKATLIAMSSDFCTSVLRALERQLEELPTAETATRSWDRNGEAVVAETREDAVRLANEYAPEHLQVMTRDPEWFHNRLRNYGTAFLGEITTTVYSDKAIGPNHILPTGRGARYTGGLWVGKYLKNVTYQEMDREAGSKVAGVAARISRSEGMIGHAMSAELRMRKFGYAKN